MPPDAWGRPARAWLPKAVRQQRGSFVRWQTVHQLKNDIYALMVKQFASPLSGAKVFALLQDRGVDCAVITGASYRAAAAALQHLGLTPLTTVSTGDKASALEAMLPCCHIDDQAIPNAPVPIIRYRGDDPTLLITKIEAYL